MYVKYDMEDSEKITVVKNALSPLFNIESINDNNFLNIYNVIRDSESNITNEKAHDRQKARERSYISNRYKTDPEYREYLRVKAREYYHKKKAAKNNIV